MELLRIFLLLALAYLIYQYINQPLPKINTNVEADWTDTEYGFGYGDANMTPKKRLRTLIKDYGPPSTIDPTPKGFAVWNRDLLQGTPFERIEIRDEQIPHDKPRPHVDFLYSYYHVEIPSHLAKTLHLISNSITYDPLKKLMSSRCHCMKGNIVTHWIVKQYANYQLSIDEAGNMHGPMTMEIFQDPSGMKALELLNEL
jgi:hypothetical protein